ncbi:DNA-directed RNA polymerase III subunit [Lachnellula subtilissima]|uniref:DNA-directed RNA polymerase III subunit n=1 Tax=Lachnellula subtilissima TaxID=602034 RepID=A0A8H8U4H8_9HELO|nr:DNA-directed RNA polymerase III subunit [Lachnellula subtilissima]
MLLFCPSCSNVLNISTVSPEDIANAGNHRLECLTCPYQYILQARYYERKTFTHKEREDMFGGKGQWDNAQRARVQCTKDGCDGDEAAYYQVQIRSADEPMTSFYKVSLCALPGEGFLFYGVRFLLGGMRLMTWVVHDL